MNKHTKTKIPLQSKFYSLRVIFTFPWAVYMCKIMMLLNNFSSETILPIFTTFHVDSTVEIGLRVCSNGHTPLTVTPIYGEKKIELIDTFLFFKTKNCSK